MPTFSISAPINIKSELQAIYANKEKCYALIKLDSFELEGASDDDADQSLLNTFQVDAEIALPIEVYVMNQSDEWVQQQSKSIEIHLDDVVVPAQIYSKDSASAQAILAQFNATNKEFDALYLKSGVSFIVTDNRSELLTERTEPTVVDVTDDEEMAPAEQNNVTAGEESPSEASEESSSEARKESSSEESAQAMEFAIRLLENEDNLNVCSVHAIYAWGDKWYVLADVAVDGRFDQLFEECWARQDPHAIEQVYTVEADKMPASVDVYWLRYGDVGNDLSVDIQRDVGAIKVAINGVDVPTSSYASKGEKADQTLKELYPYQEDIEPLYLADLDDKHEASFSIAPLDDNPDEYQLVYRVVPGGHNQSLPEQYRISQFQDEYVEKAVNNQHASAAATPTIDELADGAKAEMILPKPLVQSATPVVEEPADDVPEAVAAQPAAPTPADESLSGIPMPCANLFSYRTLYAAGIVLFAAGGYVGMKLLEQSSPDQQQTPRI